MSKVKLASKSKTKAAKTSKVKGKSKAQANAKSKKGDQEESKPDAKEAQNEAKVDVTDEAKFEEVKDEPPKEAKGEGKQETKEDSKSASTKGGEMKSLQLYPEGEPPTTSGPYSTHVFFVHCPTHNKVLLTHRNHLRWMPFTEMPSNRSWKEGAVIGLCTVLAANDKTTFEELYYEPPIDSFKCMHLMRLQMPQTQRFITRAINYVKLKSDAKNYKCCQQNIPHFDWFPLPKVRSGQVPHLWGPELVQCCKYISDKVKQKIAEFGLEEAYMYVPRDNPRNLEEEMLKSLQITQTDVERLYGDFLEHCFPSLYQTYDSFRVYMSKYKFEREETRLAKLFNAFNIARNGYLSFHELLLGLICMEPAALHAEVSEHPINPLATN